MSKIMTSNGHNRRPESHLATKEWSSSSSGGPPCPSYSAVAEARRILESLCEMAPVPPEIASIALKDVSFVADRNLPYFPIPYKETELGAALKAVEASLVCCLADLRLSEDVPNGGQHPSDGRRITISLERATAFLFQTYLATVDGLGKLDEGVKELLKDTDLNEAQSDPYRRMSANLYRTQRPGEFYHIHGSLEATTTLEMLGLKPFRPDLVSHDKIVKEIESRVETFTVEELEVLNREKRQAGIPALTHQQFLDTDHGRENSALPPWSVDQMEHTTPPCPLPPLRKGQVNGVAHGTIRPLAGIKVLDLTRIIAGPVIGRILAEYGADVLRVTSPSLPDVPFFQIDGNMGKRTAELDLKTDPGRSRFEELLRDADVVLDGYRPGAIERLGFGSKYLSELAKKRGRGFVYVSENCFGFKGEWCERPGWQQIADCVSGLAWEQGGFMKLNEPVVPPFPISDYGTGCIGAVAALTGLYHRATTGGSWHGRVSLLHYDMLLLKMGAYPSDVQRHLFDTVVGDDKQFRALRHSNSVDQVSGTALRAMGRCFPDFFTRHVRLERWFSAGYGRETAVVAPVADILGVRTGFDRGTRPNGSDPIGWDGFDGSGGDYRIQG